MKIVSLDYPHSLDELEGFFKKIRQGVVLLGECPSHDNWNVSLEEIAELTNKYPISLIESRCTFLDPENLISSDFDVSYIIKNGRIIRAQCFDGAKLEDPDLLQGSDEGSMVYDVSPTKDRISSIIRIGSQRLDPYEGKERVKLLIIPSVYSFEPDNEAIGYRNSLSDCIEIHGKNMHNHSLIFQQDGCALPIYNKKLKIVSKEKKFGNLTYHIHNYNIQKG